MSVYTNNLRYTGTSGIDVESMVTAMMKAESLKYDNLSRNKQLLVWQQQAYLGVTGKLKEFQGTYFDILTASPNMRKDTTFNSFNVFAKVGGSDTGAVKVTGTSKAQAGTYRLDVLKLATKDVYSNTTSAASSLTSSIPLSSMNLSTLRPTDTLKISLDGASPKTISFTQSEIAVLQAATNPGATQADKNAFLSVFQTKLDEFGTENGQSKLQATFDGNDKLSITALTGHDVTLYTGTSRQQQIMSSTIPRVQGFGRSTFQVKMGTQTYNLSVEMSASDTQASMATKMNQALKDAGLLGNLKVSVGTGSDKNKMIITATNTDEDVELSGNLIRIIMDQATPTPIVLSHTNPWGDFGLKTNVGSQVNPDQPVSGAFPGLNLSTYTNGITINGKNIDIKTATTVKELFDLINKADAGVKLRYDTMNNAVVFESTKTGQENIIRTDTHAARFLREMGLNHTQTAEDAEIKINNGTIITRSQNTFDMYGITVTLNDVTEPGKPVVITTERDTGATKDLIKKFVESYNTLIKDLDDEYSTSRPKQNRYNYYDPLTSEEKKNMSESEITTWEEQAKKGMLYRDPILSGILSSMRSMLYDSVTLDNGQKISLFDIGITTSKNYKDKGKLVIDEEKLIKALNERPEDVAQLFTKESQYSYTDKANSRLRMKEQGLSERFNDIINNATSTNGSLGKKAGFSAADTGSDLYKQLKAVDDKMADMMKALIEKENNYYAKFAAMEKAINNANSQMASLQGLLGQS